MDINEEVDEIVREAQVEATDLTGPALARILVVTLKRELGGLNIHRPRRGDPVEAWLKGQRDEFMIEDEAWHMLDNLLDNYRLAADTGEVWNP